MNQRDQRLLKLSIMAALHDIDKAKIKVENDICRLYPEGMSVIVRIRYGQKKLSPATVVGCPSWSAGCIKVKLDNAKAHSRQKFRSVHVSNVFIWAVT